MASLVIPGDFALITAQFTNALGHHCVNECGASFTAAPTQAQVDTLCGQLAAKYKLKLATSGGFQGIKVVYVTTGPPQVLFSTSSAGIGNHSGNLLPPQVQYLISKKTTFIGRHYRGRMFIPDAFETEVDDSGGLAVAATSQLTDIANAWATGLTTSPWVAPVLLHSTPAIPPTNISLFSPGSKVATLRRRYDR